MDIGSDMKNNADIEKWLSNYHGMELEPIAKDDSRYNENGVLFFSEYLILKYISNELSHSDIAKFKIIVENITSFDKNHSKIKGLYDRGASESLSKDKDSIRKISHDNITAISSMSKLLESEGLSYHIDIARYGFKNLMRYDNSSPDSPRSLFKRPYKDSYKWDTSIQLHPRDWFLWLTNGGYKFAWIFFPIFFLANILACLGSEKETSGKWLVFVRLETGSKWSKLIGLNKKICYWILRKKYGSKWLNKIAEIYFWQKPENPIRILSKNKEL